MEEMNVFSVYFHAFVQMVKVFCRKGSVTRVHHTGQSPIQSGQALLMVVVAMIIILTVSLSVATRSFINIRTTSEEASSSAAFSAAEAGIEKYLKNSQTFTGNVGTSNVSVNTTQIGGTGTNPRQLVLNSGNPILRDDGVDVWLSTHPGYTSPYWSGTMRVYWGSTTDCNSSAIEVVVITGPSANPLLTPSATRYAFDQCAGRSEENFFSTPITGGTVGGKSFANAADIVINAANPGIIARIIPLYKNTTIAVTGGTGFPQQGSVVSSTGSSGDTKRKISIYQGFPKVPNEFFSYTIFSP